LHDRVKSRQEHTSQERSGLSDRHDDETTEPVPEADAIEQATPMHAEPPDDDDLPEGIPDDASEADAIEQATAVSGQDEEDAPR
jgi:hypothetical protein